MRAKIQVQEEMLRGVDSNDAASQAELTEYKNSLAQYESAYGEESEETSSDAQVFISQVQQTQEGDMSQLLSDINEHDRAQDQRRKLYADYCKPEDGVQDGEAEFHANLLKHLAGSIFVKEHRIRYQKEQFDRFVASTKDYRLQKSDQSLN